MNKSILLSIRPKWVCKILNGEKTIEVRKQFPKDYKGWVYIYCTKGKPYFYGDEDGFWISHLISSPNPYHWNGKVVARFWCDKVEEIRHLIWVFDYLLQDKIYKASCLNNKTLSTYLKGHDRFYAIHISKLEVFDEPKELSEFHNYIKYTKKQAKENNQDYDFVIIKNPPQNYCYVEGEE